MRALPDPDVPFRDASDFIFDSDLGRRALIDPAPTALAVLLREVVQQLHRLAESCHLPEFTDHGLRHICSLVDRLSRWTMSGPTGSYRVIDSLAPSEASVLLLATLLHDVGMLSQKPEDMGPGYDVATSVHDIANWVRDTHIQRMRRVVVRMMRGATTYHALAHSVVERAYAVAEAHGTWPERWTGLSDRDGGLAAMLAVADLLDEDSMRCDSATLMRHRHGTALNFAHWIRHGLTSGRLLVDRGSVTIRLRKPPRTDARIEPVIRALRNHYRLIRLYSDFLDDIGAGPLLPDFDPENALPDTESVELEDWWNIPEFGSQSALVFHLLESFFAEALLDERRVSAETIEKLQGLGLESVDLDQYYRIRGLLVPRTSLEQSFHALLED